MWDSNDYPLSDEDPYAGNIEPNVFIDGIVS
jgi:hypothetical protein